MKYIKPTLVLVIITTAISALLIFTYRSTYKDTSGVVTDQLQKCCEEIMGEGEYEIVPDWLEAGYAIEKPDNVTNLVRKSDGTIAFEIITKGYATDGLHLLIAMNDDGTVKGISFVAIGETPGLGTKVQDGAFTSQFIGNGNVKLAGNGGGLYKPSSSGTDDAGAAEITAITSATFSSKGVINAVNIAVDVFAEMGGAK